VLRKLGVKLCLGGFALNLLLVLLMLLAGAAWESPNIAFVSPLAEGDIYIADLAHGIAYNLTRHPSADWHPSWSPDGAQIAFASTRDGFVNIYTMTATGRDLRRWTPNQADAISPDWSPDGKKLVFAYSYPVIGSADIYLLDLETAALTRLTENRVLDHAPDWSPDGAQIAFQSNRRGSYEIYIMNADGSAMQQMTEHFNDNALPRWSPDGAQLVYQSNRDGQWDVYLLDVATRSTYSPIDSGGQYMFPSWHDSDNMLYLSRADNGFWVYQHDLDSGETRQIWDGIGTMPAMRPTP